MLSIIMYFAFSGTKRDFYKAMLVCIILDSLVILTGAGSPV
jgi:hypothetical protein